MNKVLAVDIGGTKTIIAVVDTEYHIIQSREFKTDQDIDKTIKEISAIINEFDKEKVLKAGIAICGLLSFDRKKLLIAPNVGWHDIDLYEKFDILERDIEILNDGTAAAWGSYVTEKPDNISRLLSVTLGTGVGGGIVIDNKIITGAGEIGHMKIDLAGPECGCGKNGCLESFIGGKRIPERVKEWFGLNISSPKELQELAESGNKKALMSWEKIGNILGNALSSLVNINGIELVRIGGSVSEAGKYFLKDVQISLDANLMAPNMQKCTVLISKWRNNFSLIGAASIILDPPNK